MEERSQTKLGELDFINFITKKTFSLLRRFQSSQIVLDFNVEPGLKTATDEDFSDQLYQNLAEIFLKHGKENETFFEKGRQ